MTDEPTVVITGLGCVSPLGSGVEHFWKGLFTGCEPRPPTGFDATAMRVAGVFEVPDQDGPREDRPVRLLRGAVLEAIARAGLDSARIQGGGLVLASTSAGWHLPEQAFGGREPTSGHGPLRKEWPAVVVAEELGLTGPCAVLSSACASSTGAVAWATERIREGEAELMLVAAVDVVTEVVLAGFRSMRLLTQRRCRPFAADRDGFVLAEGAAVVVLESAGHAARRGAAIQAAITGWGASSDAGHLTTPAAEGIARSLRAALADAACRPGDIGVFHAHATASPASDLAEARAVGEVLSPGPSGLLTTAVKSAIGHTEGAAGLFTLAAAVEGLSRDEVPPVLGDGTQDPATAAVQPSRGRRVHPAGSALVHASGFGGANCTVVIGRTPNLRRAPDTVPVHLIAAGRARADGVEAVGWHPAFDERAAPLPGRQLTTPRPDHTCQLLAASVGALLGGLPEEWRSGCLNGGLLIGTEFGQQHHHARMHAALRARGIRGVDPLDFALSTFNTPASATSVIHGIRGRTETYLGATGAVEALVSGARSVRIGQVPAILVGGYDAPDNRLRVTPDSPPLPAAATVIALAPPTHGAAQAGTSVELAGHTRLPIASRPAGPKTLNAAVKRLCGRRPALLIASGLDEPDAEAGQWTRVEPAAGAVAALDAHLLAIRRIADGEAEEAVVATTGPYCATILVHYRRPAERGAG
ncbi:beta-ketoacyl synthase N-terminal-like domain-containing protein [Streptomyces shenzhenensis]|uniref:beta-ketoacyl synthase N-terminal-like domain-containing protein n=1 Tax=Streptomyces shenzhenensis TaxID=943815 RepID=UPI0015F0BF97|nr:beta-ketoacyl synthase N-terminal-like domain-containing protein [Streptomyces shenzhenensis]